MQRIVRSAEGVHRAHGITQEDPMRTSRTLALGASVLALVGACSTGGGSSTPGSSTSAAPSTGTTPASSAPASTGAGGSLTVGSDGFYESALMAEIYAQVLEANGFTVERQLEVGPRDVTFPALESGDFDLMPQYIGSTLEYLVKEDGDPAGEATGDPEETATRLRERLAERGITALAYTPAEDTNAFVMRPETAESLGIATLSDLAEHATDLTWGLPAECKGNPLCEGALEQYGIVYDDLTVVELGACGAEIATALGSGGEGAVDVGELCSTQPDIARLGLVVLEDDLDTQPAENIAPIVRDEWLEANGGAEALAAILDPVSAAMDTETLTELNVRVGVDQEDYEDVANDWLTENGLLPAG
jgi:osmoprotectant transport system substrate-binding protein